MRWGAPVPPALGQARRARDNATRVRSSFAFLVQLPRDAKRSLLSGPLPFPPKAPLAGERQLETHFLFTGRVAPALELAQSSLLGDELDASLLLSTDGGTLI